METPAQLTTSPDRSPPQPAPLDLDAPATPAATTVAARRSQPPLALFLILAGSLALRLVGLGWGVPALDPATLAHSPYRTTYHLDEANYLWALVQMRPAAGDWDIRDYHWGALQFYLIDGVLLGGEAVGLIPAPWEAAFRDGDAAALPRLFLLGRLVSVAAALAATAAVVALGTALGGRRAGLAAGVAYTITPFAVVEAHYLTGDMTMSALVAGAVLAAVLAAGSGRGRLLLLAGGLLGLATAAKYSGLGAAPGLLVAQWAIWRTPGAGRGPGARGALALGPWLALAGGFVLGEPAAVLAPGEVLVGLQNAAQANALDPAYGAKGPLAMLGWQAYHLAGQGLTWPLAALAVGGLLVLGAALVIPRRRAGHAPAPPPARPGARRAGAGVLLAALLGLAAELALNRVFMLRYSQPLVPLLAVAAGVGWAAIPRAGWRTAAGALAATSAGVITLGQLSLLTGPHPADGLPTWLVAHVGPGQQVARLWPAYPVLDEIRYRLVRLDPWRPDMPPGVHPDYVILDDMALGPATPALTGLLAGAYAPVARFAARPHLGPFAWDEGETPHDWKYSHPQLVVYARR